MVDTKTALATLGWRVNTPGRLQDAIEDFQRGWNLGIALKVDGDDGPLTRAALATSVARRGLGRPDFSEHFSAVEFRCACGGADPTCRRIWVQRKLVQALEVYRGEVGPLGIERGCRCPTANKAVGGAQNSQHLYGSAADVIVYRVSVAKVRSLAVASGIGTYTYNGAEYPRHLDVRHVFGTVDPRNTTDSTIARPALWNYGAAKYPPLTPRPEPDQPTAPTAPTTPTAPAPEEDPTMFMVRRKDKPEVYKTDGFKRVHITATERDALLAVGVKLTETFTTDEQLAAFGPIVDPSKPPT